MSSTHPLTALRVQALTTQRRPAIRCLRFPATTGRDRDGCRDCSPSRSCSWALPVVLLGSRSPPHHRNASPAANSQRSRHYRSSSCRQLPPNSISGSRSARRGSIRTLSSISRSLPEPQSGRPTPRGRHRLTDAKRGALRARRPRSSAAASPGAFWSGLILSNALLPRRDRHPLRAVLDHNPFRFARLFFAITDFAGELIGQHAVIDGWYRRRPSAVCPKTNVHRDHLPPGVTQHRTFSEPGHGFRSSSPAARGRARRRLARVRRVTGRARDLPMSREGIAHSFRGSPSSPSRSSRPHSSR